jgi:hypothetical protein
MTGLVNAMKITRNKNLTFLYKVSRNICCDGSEGFLVNSIQHLD